MEWLRKLRAKLGGYFWLPCPICGRMFAGFEMADTTLMTSLTEGDGVCSRCEDAALSMNFAKFGLIDLGPSRFALLVPPDWHRRKLNDMIKGADLEKAAFSLALTKEILSLLKDSGASEKESLCALDAAKAVVPSLRLSTDPTLTIGLGHSPLT